MIAALLLFAIWWAPLFALAALLNTKSPRPVFWGWLLLAMLIHAVFMLATQFTQPAGTALFAPEARWLSRVAGLAVGIGFTALLLRRHRQLMPRALGLTWRQAPGSIGFSLLGIVVLALLGTLPQGFALFAEGAPSLAAVAYHLTLPGIEQELMYRGLLLSLLVAGLGKRPAAVFWGGVMANMLFALDHGIFWQDGGIGFNLAAIAITGVAGAVLTVMRLKSGSLLPGMIGYNLLGLAGRLA